MNFNPRSRKGSDTSPSRLPGRRKRFQSTLPQGERPVQDSVRFLALLISIHAPARGATVHGRAVPSFGQFQSTLPQGERLRKEMLPKHSRRFQSTLPQGERQISRQGYPLPDMISIHAPARGATIEFAESVQNGVISIHAPARGATVLVKLAALIRRISIHAPARGATTVMWSFQIL